MENEISSLLYVCVILFVLLSSMFFFVIYIYATNNNMTVFKVLKIGISSFGNWNFVFVGVMISLLIQNNFIVFLGAIAYVLFAYAAMIYCAQYKKNNIELYDSKKEC